MEHFNCLWTARALVAERSIILNKCSQRKNPLKKPEDAGRRIIQNPNPKWYWMVAYLAPLQRTTPQDPKKPEERQQRYHCRMQKIGTKSSVHTHEGRHAWPQWGRPWSTCSPTAVPNICTTGPAVWAWGSQHEKTQRWTCSLATIESLKLSVPWILVGSSTIRLVIFCICTTWELVLRAPRVAKTPVSWRSSACNEALSE